MAIYTARMATTLAINTIIELDVESTGQDIANNRTNFKYTLKIKKINNYNDNFRGSASVVFSMGGTTVLNITGKYWTIHGVDHSHAATTEYLLGSGNFVVNHNSDGTKVAPISVTVDPQVTGASWGTTEDMAITGNMTLAAIPRTSIATLNKTTFDFGETVTLTTNKHSTAFTHTVSYLIGATETTIATSVVDTTSVVIPGSLITSYPNNSSVNATVRCKTYSGATLIGTSNIAVTVNIPASYVPSVSAVAIAKTDTVTKGIFDAGVENTEYIRGLSTLEATATAAGSGGSTIVSYVYRLKTNGLQTTGSTNKHTFPSFNFPASDSATDNVQVAVIDSRGRQSAWKDSAVFRVHYYQPPQMGTLKVTRSGTSLIVTRNYTVTNLYQAGNVALNKNTLPTFTIETRPKGGAWTTNAGGGSTTMTLSNSNATLTGTYATTSSFEVRAKLVDKINAKQGTVVYSGIVSVSTAGADLSLSPNNKGIGAGKIWDTSITASLQVGSDGINSDGPITGTRYNNGTNYITSNGAYTRIQNANGYIEFGPANIHVGHISTDRPSFYFNKELQVNGGIVWNANNDGAGSGLDADLLDGNHASAFALAGHTHTNPASSVYFTTGGSGFDRWIRFSTGETFAWGRHSSSASTGTFSFSRTFTTAPLVTLNASIATNSPGFNLTGISTTDFSIRVVNSATGAAWASGTYMVHYHAMGMS